MKDAQECNIFSKQDLEWHVLARELRNLECWLSAISFSPEVLYVYNCVCVYTLYTYVHKTAKLVERTKVRSFWKAFFDLILHKPRIKDLEKLFVLIHLWMDFEQQVLDKD